jgi:phosphatidylserine/phosphatidylglycerophosphate/cardiolipin synthase-like enzyme
MDDFDIGTVHEIGSSGKAWMGYNSRNIADLLFEELRLAGKSVQISSFSIGNDTDVLRDFFDILEKKLDDGKSSAREDHTFHVSMIINDDGQKNSQNSFAKEKISELQYNYPEQFFASFFKQTKIGNLHKTLHAKLVVIDGHIALVGSANLSKGALEASYEIMLKVKGEVAFNLAKMLQKLQNDIENKTA